MVHLFICDYLLILEVQIFGIFIQRFLCMCIIYTVSAYVDIHVKMQSLQKHSKGVQVLHFCVSGIFTSI